MFTMTGAIILAAGNFRRFGKSGSRLQVGGERVRGWVRAVHDGGIDDILVVLGHDRWRVAAALAGLPVCMAVHERPEDGMAESIRIGIAGMPKYVTGILMVISEYPLVAAETCRVLDHYHALNPGRILLPARNGRSGHPLLFPESICHPEAATSQDFLMNQHHSLVLQIPVDDPGVLAMDIATHQGQPSNFMEKPSEFSDFANDFISPADSFQKSAGRSKGR